MLNANAGGDQAGHLEHLWIWAKTNSAIAVALLVGLLASLATFFVGCLSSVGVWYSSRNAARMQMLQLAEDRRIHKHQRRLKAGEELYQLFLKETKHAPELTVLMNN